MTKLVGITVFSSSFPQASFFNLNKNMEQERKINTEYGHCFVILTVKDLKIIFDFVIWSWWWWWWWATKPLWCRDSYVASVSVRALDTQTTLQHLLLYLRCHSGRAFVCTFISLLFFLSSKAAVYLEQRGRSIANSFDELSVAKHRQLSLFLSRRLLSFYLFAGFSVCPLSQSRPIFHPVSWPRPWVFSFKDTAFLYFFQHKHTLTYPFLLSPPGKQGKYLVSGYWRVFVWYTARLCSQA